MKKVERSFSPGDRYQYDFGKCSYQNGWAQLDSGQDAWYYGNWINPTARRIMTYCEGDVIEVAVDTDAELVAEVEAMKKWNIEQGHRFIGIDQGLSDEFAAVLESVGLEPYFSWTEKDGKREFK